jgi:ATP-binding cassette subfamily F protein uup
MKTVQRLQKRKQSRKRMETKQPTGNLTFNEQKKYQKNRKEIKDLEVQKIALEQLFTDEKYRIMTFQKKQELENINNKIEDREERWFELSAKIEG